VVAGFCLPPQQTLATGLGHSNPKGRLQLSIANLTKAGTLERRGEGETPVVAPAVGVKDVIRSI
jgi:hypothetical protein